MNKKKILDEKVNIERSIITTFRSRIWSKFTKAVAEYKLIDKDDHIAVCISGGKDSFLLAMCMQLLEKYGEVPFKATYLVMNPGYSKENVTKIKENANKLGINIVMYETDIFDIVDLQDKGSPCYLCARMRRGALYRKAEELGCNKIALGHHFDDVIETILLSMFYGGKVQSMMPKLHSDNYKGLELIRPLYYVREKDILAWKEKSNLSFLQCACHFTASKEEDSKRKEVKHLLEELRKINKNIDMNIFKSMYNVNVDTAIAYQKDTVTYHFLDSYNEKANYHGKEQFARNKLLYKEEGMDRLYNSSVAIFGIGGVGGQVCESLARAGVSTFYLYDNDEVDITNINRQVVANFKTIGKDKVAVMENIIYQINPDAKVYTYKMFIDNNTIKDIDFNKFTYCADCLDTLKTKVLLIAKAKENNIPLISAMGAGNKLDPTKFIAMDLSKTTYDPIARYLRKELKAYNITNQKVVCSIEQPINNDENIIASNPLCPRSEGLVMANEIIKDIINSQKESK